MRLITHTVPGLTVILLSFNLAITSHGQQLPTDLTPVAASDIPRSVCNYYSIQKLSSWPSLPFNWLSDSNILLYVSPSVGANVVFVGDQDIDYAQHALRRLR